MRKLVCIMINDLKNMNAKNFSFLNFPKSRIATIDVCSAGLKKHHVASFIELDVTGVRVKLRECRQQKEPISFFAWLIKAISLSIARHPTVAAYRKGRRGLVVFSDINISVAVEKEVNGTKVPIPLVIEKASEKTVVEITRQISEAKTQLLSGKDIVLQKKTNRIETLYYLLPGFVRRLFWHFLLKNPHFAFRKMGNVAVTSVGGQGGINAWFVPISVHPVCFGIGDIVKKPVVISEKVEIREMLNLTILFDHDVTDGMEMAGFLKTLTRNVGCGISLK